MFTESPTHQQFTAALAIPAKAWINPGPGTTKQPAGLQKKQN